MNTPPMSPEQETQIEELVQHYVSNQAWHRRFLIALHGQISEAIDPQNRDPLSHLVHSVKFRLKDPSHLRDKLTRKMAKCVLAKKIPPSHILVKTYFKRLGTLRGIVSYTYTPDSLNQSTAA